MKKIYFFPLIIFSLGGSAQKRTMQDLQQTYRESIKYIAYAPEWIPSLMEKGEYELLQNFLNNWETAPYNNGEFIISIRLLQALESHQGGGFQLHCDALLYLDNYARMLAEVERDTGAFKYLLHVDIGTFYDATEHARRLLQYIQARALRLESAGGMNRMELFFCGILSGRIPHPQKAFDKDPSVCPQLAALRTRLEAHNDSVFRERRKEPTGTAAITAGVWSPHGNLGSMGTHPSLGFLLGWRNRLNEIDADFSFRFTQACSPYGYEKDDTLYVSQHYDGGTLGLTYTRYLLHLKYFETGIMAGAGWDYIDLGAGSGPVKTISSMDFLGGLRMKYFFRRKGYLGMAAQYHLLNHCNTIEGNDLGGNAWSLTLSYGSR